MAEETQGSPETQSEGSAEAPSALTAEQVSKIVQEAMDSRVSGLQSSIDKRFSGVEKELQRATMTEREIEDQEDEAEAAELQRLRAENAILSAGADMPAAVKAYQELNAKQNGREQLEFIQSLIDAAAQTKSSDASSDEPTEDDEDTPPVDPNRGGIPDLTPEAAGGILDQFESWPGADFFRRG